MKTVEEDVKHETAKMVRELESQAKENADKKDKRVMLSMRFRDVQLTM